VELIQAGMNVARLNFSHGEHAVHGQTIANVRAVDEQLGTHTALLADLQGPKLRIGELEGGQIQLVDGEELLIRTGKEVGSQGVVYTSYLEFARDVKPGEPVLMDDGKLELKVIETDGKGEVKCEVVHGGVLKPRKGINLPSTAISLPCITEKDAVDLAFALEQDVDWVGLSFVRNGQDIVDLRQRIEAAKANTPASSQRLRSRRRWRTSMPSLRRPMRSWLPEVTSVWRFPKQEVPIVQKGHHQAVHATWDSPSS
jgi:pyruvate kinase